MEIKVRNIDSNIVHKIDKLAKVDGESRENFLRCKIEEIAYKNEINTLEKKYQVLIDTLIDVIKNHTKVLGSFMDEFIIDGEDAFNINYKDMVNSSLTLNTDLQYYSNEKSELKVRDVPIDVIQRIEEIALKRNISRNEFLNLYLRQLTYSSKLKLVDERYNYSIEKTLGILDFSNRVLEVFIKDNIICLPIEDKEGIN